MQAYDQSLLITLKPTCPFPHPSSPPPRSITLFSPQPSDTAVGGNWLCNLGQQLDSGIKAAASSSTSGAYAAKATTAVQKLGDFLAGRWASSPWWTLQADATLPQLVAACPITV